MRNNEDEVKRRMIVKVIGVLLRHHALYFPILVCSVSGNL